VPDPFHPAADVLADLVSEDRIGYETLRRMTSVARYNRWIFEELSPFAGSHVLEAGCGIGNMTAYFLDRELLVAIDRLPASVQLTAKRYQSFPNVQVMRGDISDPQLPEQLASWSFDTALCVNVLEHVEDDLQALRHLWRVLQPAGRLLLLVPAGRYLYGTLDRALGHYRRYDRRQLAALVQMAGFQTLALHYMNLAGIPGWWLNSRVLKQRLLPEGQLRWFDRLAPIFIRSERLLRRVWDVPAGQSLVCIAQKKT